jgi:hypothetical protein
VCEAIELLIAEKKTKHEPYAPCQYQQWAVQRPLAQKSRRTDAIWSGIDRIGVHRRVDTIWSGISRIGVRRRADAIWSGIDRIGIHRRADAIWSRKICYLHMSKRATI